MDKRIIIADDDEFLTSMYRISLQAPGREIIVTHDGKEALGCLEKSPPDLLILDLMMPVLDGFGVLAAMKEKGLSCPVIILSNVSDKVDQQRCIDLGAKDFFLKSSTDLNGLIEKVKKFVP